MHIQFTNRGFPRADFVDQYGEACSIQDSSIATEDCIWLGCNAGTHHQGQCMARMHLTRAMVAELLPILQRFVATGTIAPDDDGPID